ncbi:Efflux transporter, outer membrane factor lipoprotein, NodT family [Desulfosarcina cetonica]|uniref:efflux transporter outer membrane subunit n=1 Tax=Desulfosarcina cetonica TaxID=90730 RepID=UPI0006D0A9BC|nr:efflux transporter outer membrane subunit [Desulfosarcina cetonica]VTR67320.1 Efflux transporter, outer membrane factor lipoprotein, NodT family [Desulfosarcina cetonica]
MDTHKIICNGFKRFVLVAVLFAGCAVGPDFTDPVVRVPDAYRTPVMPADTAADLNWWELFDDPLLYRLVATALENNRDLQIAASRIEQARATVGFTRADQYPQLDGQAGASIGNFSGGSRSTDTNASVYLAAPLTWEVDFWGKYRRSTEAARAELVASDYGLKTIQLSLIAGVVSTYYQILDYRQRLDISVSTLASRSRSLEIIQQRFGEGIIAEIDVNQAQIQKEIAAAAIPLYERAIAQTENRLSILLGQLPGAIETTRALSAQPLPPDIPVGMPSTLLDRRPDIVQAKYQLKAQTERIGVAQALRLPAVSLTGTLGVANTEIGTITSKGEAWSIGGQLLAPILDFGKNKRRVEIEEEKTRQALFQYQSTVLTAFREVEDALVAIRTYRQELAATQRQQRAAKNANALSKERYNRGVSSYLEVLDTERTLFSAELQLSELQQLYLGAYVNLYKALGGGWITPDAPVHDSAP